MSAKPIDERKAFYARIGEHAMTPLWEVLHNLVPPQPTTPCVPAMWRYETVRPFLMESGRLISAAEAAVGLAMVITVYRHYRTTNVDQFDQLKG